MENNVARNNQQKMPKVGLLKSLFNLPKIIRNPALYFQQLLKENDGMAEVKLHFGSACLTDHPGLMRYVLQKNHRNYTKTDIVKTIVREQVGLGLLTSEGGYWLKQRRAIQPGFHRKRLDGISKIMVNEINHYMDKTLDVYAEKEQEVDLTKVMTDLAFKIVSKSLFGSTADSEKMNTMDEVVSKGQQYIVNQIRKPFLKPWYKISGAVTENKKSKERGDKLIADLIKEQQESGEKQDDLLDMLLETRYEDGSSMTDQQLLDEAIILYVAGHETSAVAMSWALYLIATHPEIESKLLQSVQDTIGDQDPTFADTRTLAYALQVVEETMRLYPPAWLIDRAAIEDDEFEGIPIKKGRDIVCLIYSVHRNPKYWQDPEEFDPSRFSPENKSKQIPFSYMPFGGGPRLCIGNNFALMEMQFAIAMILRRYTFEIIPDQKIEINPLVTLKARYGIKAKVKRRN